MVGLGGSIASGRSSAQADQTKFGTAQSRLPPLAERRFPPWKGERPGQLRIRSFGQLGFLCAPTAHQTNGVIGVSLESE